MAKADITGVDAAGWHDLLQAWWQFVRRHLSFGHVMLLIAL